MTATGQTPAASAGGGEQEIPSPPRLTAAEEAACQIFERRIAPTLDRIDEVERNEAALAERVDNARGRCPIVEASTVRLDQIFPDVLEADPSDRRWVLRPFGGQLRAQWEVRRRTIVETEVPVLDKAAQAAAAAAADAEERCALLPSRLEVARRSRVTVPTASEAAAAPRAARGWRRLLPRLFRRSAQARTSALPADAPVGPDDVAKAVVDVVEAGRRMERRHAELRACSSALQRLEARIDALGPMR